MPWSPSPVRLYDMGKTHAMPLLGMIYNISFLVFNINSCQSCDFWSFWSFSTTKISDSTEPQAFRSIARWPRPLLSTRAPNASRAAAQPAVRAAAGVPVAVLPWWMSRHSQKRTRWLGWTWLNMHFLEFSIWWLGNHVICLWYLLCIFCNWTCTWLWYSTLYKLQSPD